MKSLREGILARRVPWLPLRTAKRILGVASLGLGLCFSALPSHATVVDSVNAGGTPCLGSSCSFVVNGVGWYYTAPFSYTLTDIDFNFSATDAGTVTELLYSTTTPALGGTLLRSASFSPTGSGFTGGSFAALSIVGGQAYFVGVTGVQGFDGMVDSGGGTILPVAIDTGNNGLFALQCGVGNCTSSGQVMMEFVNTTNPVPEPETYAMILAGLGLLGWVARRRKQNVA